MQVYDEKTSEGFERFSSLEIFKGLAVEEIAFLSEKLRVYQYSVGEILSSPYKSSQKLFILLKGTVKLYRLSSDGKVITTGYANAGDIFGNMPLLEQELGHNFVEAISPIEVLALNCEEVETYLLSNLKINQMLVRMLIKRVRDLEYHLSALALKPLQGRVVAILMYLKRKQFMDEEHFVYITHEDMAHMVGANRENVTKVLNELQEKGCIELHRGRIKILKIDDFQNDCSGNVS
jgi:CRP/FNR family transcriptional regulator, cyclic AMP receptor protein